MFFRDNRSSKVFDISLVSIWTFVLTLFTYSANGRKIGIDDADIFFTYASNLANGQGLVYSQGIPRVEGYTSTLWMLLCSLVFKLGFSEKIIWVLSLLLFASTSLIAFRILEISIPRSRWVHAKVIYLVIISLSFGYSSWMLISLMDTTLWGFLLMSVIYLFISPPNHKKKFAIGSLVFFLLPLSRPESILLIPLIFVSIIVVERKWLTKSLGLYFTVFVISAVSLTIFRYSYFGFPFPNTYYAKVSDSVYSNFTAGNIYTFRFLQSSLFALIAFLVSIMYICWYLHLRYMSKSPKSDKSDYFSSHKSLLLLGLMTLNFIVVTIFSGGDHFNLYRILQPIWPFTVLIFTLLYFELSSVFKQSGKSLFVFFAIILIVISELIASSAFTSWTFSTIQGRSSIAHEFEIAEDGRSLGGNLNNLFEELNFTPSVGAITAGGIARTYKGTIYDLMGLNNSEMAHGSTSRVGFRNHAIFDERIFLNWSVDVLLATPESWGMDVALKGLSSDIQFTRQYRYGCLTDKVDQAPEVCAYFRKDFIAEIDANADLTIVLSE